MVAQQGKKQFKNIILSLLFLVLIGTTLWLIVRNTIMENTVLPLSHVEGQKYTTNNFSEQIEGIMRDDVIHNERFLKLEQHGGIPITVGKVGKSNPFLP